MCIAFVDPGNLEADLQTGATTGYQVCSALCVYNSAWRLAHCWLSQSLQQRDCLD
jgi:hypothetical protein